MIIVPGWQLVEHKNGSIVRAEHAVNGQGEVKVLKAAHGPSVDGVIVTMCTHEAPAFLSNDTMVHRLDKRFEAESWIKACDVKKGEYLDITRYSASDINAIPPFEVLVARSGLSTYQVGAELVLNTNRKVRCVIPESLEMFLQFVGSVASMGKIGDGCITFLSRTEQPLRAFAALAYHLFGLEGRRTASTLTINNTIVACAVSELIKGASSEGAYLSKEMLTMQPALIHHFVNGVLSHNVSFRPLPDIPRASRKAEATSKTRVRSRQLIEDVRTILNRAELPSSVRCDTYRGRTGYRFRFMGRSAKMVSDIIGGPYEDLLTGDQRNVVFHRNRTYARVSSVQQTEFPEVYILDLMRRVVYVQPLIVADIGILN